MTPTKNWVVPGYSTTKIGWSQATVLKKLGGPRLQYYNNWVVPGYSTTKIGWSQATVTQKLVGPRLQYYKNWVVPGYSTTTIGWSQATVLQKLGGPRRIGHDFKHSGCHFVSKNKALNSHYLSYTEEFHQSITYGICMWIDT